MLKEVGASGQISLGKKYAGQLFEVETQADGTIVMRPMKVVPMKVVPMAQPHVAQEELAAYKTNPISEAHGDSFDTPERKKIQKWSYENVQCIEQYNAWAEKRQPYSQRVRQWREAK
ncbi:MAG: hypothetical protein RIR45_1253 [Pseudomonadota bacterium]